MEHNPTPKDPEYIQGWFVQIIAMDELYQVNTEPTMDMIRHASRTRSDSNSFTIDNSEFDRDVLGLLDNNQHALICFASLYEDFKMGNISMNEFSDGIQTLCVPSTSRRILELVKLNCPIERYPDIESFLESTADATETTDRTKYEQDLKEQYTMLETQLREIDSVAEDHQQGLSPDHDIFKALKRIRKGCRATLHEMKRVMRDEECGYTVNRLDEFKETIDQLTIQLQDKVHACHYLEDDYDPLLDDDSINSMVEKNHDWLISTIKTAKKGDLKRKRFTLFPRSQRSIEIYCQEDDRVMCYWSEDEGSRLLFDAYYEPDGVDRKIEVVPLLVRVSKYCFLFHATCPGNLVLHWNNKLSFRKKKHIHSYARRLHGEDGVKLFKEYDKRYAEILDVQSKFLVKLPIEGGVLTMKATSTCQREDGIHYTTICYWRSGYYENCSFR